MQNFMLNLLRKKIKNNCYSRTFWTLKFDGAFWSNLKYLNKSGVHQRTLKLEKDLEIPYVSHFISLLIIICTLYSKFQSMTAKLLLVQNWGKMAHLSQPTTGTSFGKFIYTTIVCNDYTPLSLAISNFKFEANLSLEDMTQLCRQNPPSHRYTYPKN